MARNINKDATIDMVEVAKASKLKDNKDKRPNFKGKRSEQKGNKWHYNAPDWYGSGQPLLDAANLAFGEPLGQNIQLHTYVSNQATKLTQQWKLPGIMAIGLQPLLNASDGSSTATIQDAARKMYAFIRHANSGSKNYERSDLMMYYAAVADLYALIAWATLAYGCCFTYERKNSYYGKILVEALGFDFDDLLNNLSDFRAFINARIEVLNTLFIPNKFKYLDRKINLYSHIIKDASDPKGCVYVFRPESFLQWDGTTYTTGTSLMWRNSASGDSSTYTDAGSLFNEKLTFDAFQDLANGLFDAITDDEDAGIISGDILKAYGESGLKHLGLVPTDFTVAPTYDIEALEVINNITFVGTPTAPEGGREQKIDPTIQTAVNWHKAHNFGVYQLNNKIVSDPYFGCVYVSTPVDETFNEAGSAYYGPIFSLHSETTPEMVMVTSRLKACTYYAQDSLAGGYFYKYYKLLTAGTEVATRYRIYTTDTNYTEAQVVGNGVMVPTGATKKLGLIETFDWHPIIYVKVGTATSADVDSVHYEFDNYTVTTPHVLSKMNRTALLALFDLLSTM